jgi:hypothetical protein
LAGHPAMILAKQFLPAVDFSPRTPRALILCPGTQGEPPEVYTPLLACHTRAVIRRGSRRDRRSRRSGKGLSVGALLAAEIACVLAWALTGELVALLAALVAGLGLVVEALGTEDRPPHQWWVR